MIATPPLFMLAEGRRPRLRKAPTIRPKEVGLHIGVATILRLNCLPGWLWFHVPNGEIHDKREAAKLKAMGVKPGVPAFVLISPLGSACLEPLGSAQCLELQRHGEVLSDDQEAFRIHCLQRGIPYQVARSIDEAVTTLSSWGCLLGQTGGAV